MEGFISERDLSTIGVISFSLNNNVVSDIVGGSLVFFSVRNIRSEEYFHGGRSVVRGEGG